MLKPHRVFGGRLGSYAAEAGAFVRRRRHHRRSYVRLVFEDGSSEDLPLDSPRGGELSSLARALIERSNGQ